MLQIWTRGSSHAGLFLFTNEEQRKVVLWHMYKFNTFSTQLALYDQYRTLGKHHHCKKENTHTQES